MEIYLIYRRTTDGIGVIPHCCVSTLTQAQSLVERFNRNLRNLNEYSFEKMRVF